MIVGLETGIEALNAIKRILESGSTGRRDALMDDVISALRSHKSSSEAPFLMGLAEAIEDGLIHSDKMGQEKFGPDSK